MDGVPKGISSIWNSIEETEVTVIMAEDLNANQQNQEPVEKSTEDSRVFVAENRPLEENDNKNFDSSATIPPVVPPHRTTSGTKVEQKSAVLPVKCQQEQQSQSSSRPVEFSEELARDSSIDVDEIASSDQFVAATSDMFADPGAMDYLQNVGNGGAGDFVDSELYRQSLYVKFDPLVAKNRQGEIKMNTATDNVGAREYNEQLLNRTWTRDDLLSAKTLPPTSTSTKNNSSAAVANKSRSEVKLAEDTSSQTFTKKRDHQQQKQGVVSKDMDTILDVDKLLLAPSSSQEMVDDAFLSVLNSLLDSAFRDVQVPGNENQMEVLAQKLKLQFQAVLLAKEREWSSQSAKQQQKIEKLSGEVKRAKEEADQAKQQASEMSLVVSEYEKTIGQLMNEGQNMRRGDYELILRERDQAFEDLQSVENAFADLHRRYEKLRNSTEDFKKNEESLKKSVQDYQAKLKKAEEKFHRLKENAEGQLEKANTEIDKLIKLKESDTLALRAQLKKRDLQVETLEKSLETKQKEISELTAICDELIQKAGTQQSST